MDRRDNTGEQLKQLMIMCAGVAGIAFLLLHQQRQQRRRRRCWTRPWLLRRPLYGQYENLMAELVREDTMAFKNFQRVDPELFQELLVCVGPHF